MDAESRRVHHPGRLLGADSRDSRQTGRVVVEEPQFGDPAGFAVSKESRMDERDAETAASFRKTVP